MAHASATTEEDYASLSNILQQFTSIPTIDKAWLFKSNTHSSSSKLRFIHFFFLSSFILNANEFLSTALGMFSITQPHLFANQKRTFILSYNLLKESESSVKFLWAPFPVEMSGVSMIVPSPSGSKLLAIRNPENEVPYCRFEIWSSSHLEKEFHIPQSLHGSVYTDGWSVNRFTFFAFSVFTQFNVKQLAICNFNCRHN